MGKYDDIARDITFDPPVRHPLAGKSVLVEAKRGSWEPGVILHVFGNNQYYLVVIKDYYYFMNRRFECVRSHKIQMVDDD